MFLLNSSVLGPTLVCQGLDILVTAEASCEPCSATCLGSLWFMETGGQVCEKCTDENSS